MRAIYVSESYADNQNMPQSIKCMEQPLDTGLLTMIDHIRATVLVLELAPTGLPVSCTFNRFAREVAGVTEADILGKSAGAFHGNRFGVTAR